MWILEGYRVINSVAGWVKFGEYDSVDRALDAIIYSGYALDYRIKTPDGEYKEVQWREFCDEDGCEYCEPTL